MPTDLPDVLRIETISTLAGLERLRSEWGELWAEIPLASPFQSPGWLIAWWRHLGGEGLRTLAVWNGARLVGLAPLFLYTHPRSGIRQLTLLGNGMSDRLDVLAHPGEEVRVIAALLERLAATADWDLCDFRDLAAGSPLLRAPVPPGLAVESVPDEPCPALRLPPSVERLEEAVPSRLLKGLRYARRRAEREGGVRLETATEATVARDLDALFRLHRARWAERGEEGMLHDQRVECFHREVAADFARGGLLRLHTLRVGERIAAVLYGFHAHRRTYYYLGGFDPALKILSPGNLVLLHAIETAVHEGAEEFDFLRGREPYKYDWGAVDRPHVRQRWSRRGAIPGRQAARAATPPPGGAETVRMEAEEYVD